MKEYNKPFIEDEDIEIVDIILESRDFDDFDESNPFVVS